MMLTQKKVKEKIYTNSGETLAETLVAALIAALGLLLLASMIMNATHIVEKSQMTMKDFYEGLSAVEAKSGDSTPGTITINSKRLVSSGKDTSNLINISIDVDKYSKNKLYSYIIEE